MYTYNTCNVLRFFFYQTQIRNKTLDTRTIHIQKNDTHTEKRYTCRKTIHIQKNRNFDETNENPIRFNAQ